MRFFKMKSTFLAFALFFSAMISTVSHAATCQVQPQTGVFNVGDISFPRDAKRGVPLTNWIRSGTKRTHTQCVRDDPASNNFSFDYNSPGVDLGQVEIDGASYAMFATHTPGVGVIARAGAYGASTKPITARGLTSLATVNVNFTYGEADLEIRLVTTGEKSDGYVGGQILGGNTVMQDCIGGYCTRPSFAQHVDWTTGLFNIVTKTCSVTDRNITFALPSVRNSDFPAVGSTAGAITKNLQLDCSSTANIYMVVSDQTTPSNRTSTLTLTPDSGAKGFGIEVLHNDIPVRFGPDSASAGAENQFNVGSNLSGAISIPLTARYIRTSASLMAGSVKGLATFTMSYQ